MSDTNPYINDENVHINNLNSSQILGRLSGSILCAFFYFIIFAVITQSNKVLPGHEIVFVVIGSVILLLGVASFYLFTRLQYHIKTLKKILFDDTVKKDTSYKMDLSMASLYNKLYKCSVVISSITALATFTNLLYFNFSSNYLSSTYINSSGIIITLIILHNIYRTYCLKNYIPTFKE